MTMTSAEGIDYLLGTLPADDTIPAGDKRARAIAALAPVRDVMLTMDEVARKEREGGPGAFTRELAGAIAHELRIRGG